MKLEKRNTVSDKEEVRLIGCSICDNWWKRDFGGT